ncbi:MAG: 16S rRNA (uracil(1498)-N(3))-methyltransferase [Clostridia bacterium]|jgi:16S rRNA (uracil1498-N3)-methyltransferase|nr:16S rRNA (uracil(1498)-N(3))-methyltransferase [Clostridia bacterium]
MPRYFVEKSNINNNNIKIVGEDVKHISKVLRSKPGDILEVSDGDGMDYEVEVIDVFEKEIETKIISKKENETEPKIRLKLFQALGKSDKMDLVIQKAVELGIDEIYPVVTKYTVVEVKDKKKENKKLERWNKIAESAAKQSGRGKIPEVREILSFKEAIKISRQFDKTIIFYEKEKENTLNKSLGNFTGNTIAYFVGPEGGFSKEEIESAEDADILTLGKRILRTETVPIVVTGIIMNIMEEM